jgi:hypothetical protein
VCDSVCYILGMASRKATASDPKQLIHVRLETSILKVLDKYSKKSKWTRSMSVRKIIKQWAEGAGK